MPEHNRKHRADGLVPLDDICDRKRLSEDKVAYRDGNSTVHIANLDDTKENGELPRQTALSPHEEAQLSEFLAE